MKKILPYIVIGFFVLNIAISYGCKKDQIEILNDSIHMLVARYENIDPPDSNGYLIINHKKYVFEKATNYWANGCTFFSADSGLYKVYPSRELISGRYFSFHIHFVSDGGIIIPGIYTWPIDTYSYTKPFNLYESNIVINSTVDSSNYRITLRPMKIKVLNKVGYRYKMQLEGIIQNVVNAPPGLVGDTVKGEFNGEVDYTWIK